MIYYRKDKKFCSAPFLLKAMCLAMFMAHIVVHTVVQYKRSGMVSNIDI